MEIPPELPPPEAPKPGPLLLVGTAALVLLNMWLGFAREMRASGNFSAALGGATAQLLIPGAIALLFSIGRRFRNARSRTRVFFWTSVVVLLAAIGNLGQK